MQLFLKIVNGIAAILNLAVMALAAYLPPELGRGATDGAKAWQMIGVIAGFCVFIVVIRFFRYSTLVLLFACVFFFVSCSANFRWGGG